MVSVSRLLVERLYVEYWLNTVLTTFQSSTQTKFRVEVSESMCQKKDELSRPLNVSQVICCKESPLVQWRSLKERRVHEDVVLFQPRVFNEHDAAMSALSERFIQGMVFVSGNIQLENLATCIGCYDNYLSRIGQAYDEPLLPTPATLISILKQFNTQYMQKEMTCKRSFSLIRNWRQLTKQVDHDGDQFIACIDGLRVYTLIIIIIGHRGEAITSGPLINGNAVEQFANALVVLSSTSEDGEIEFRVSRGFFQRGFLQRNFSGEERLTPAYMTVVAFEAWFLYDVSSGPLWKNKAGRERDNCLNNWWTNALHINNYVQAEFPPLALYINALTTELSRSRSVPRCIDPAWFIACDVQMFLCAPLFMILLMNNRRLGVAMLSLAIVASVVLPFTLTYVYNLDPTIIADPSTLGHTSTTKTYLSTYITTYCRCGPYLVGMLAAHWLYNMRTNKANIGKITLWLGWVFSPLVSVAVIAMGYEFYQPSLHLGRFGNALYSGMHRTTFGACISFIIVACATGNGGVVARILEWKMLRPFSRLSYSVFLVHTVVQMVHYAAIRSPEYMNNTRMSRLPVAPSYHSTSTSDITESEETWQHFTERE
uniref:(California timema) hypothetical protein n=1 Tax=Timema californicum TaxID=61474 RepID=A0A7R9IYR4_TIMCA|nr:unnamed protein product [Timema californicum]